MKKQGIYKITNLINNNCYIGQSTNIEARFKNHRERPFYPNNEKNQEYNKVLYRAIRKYGLNNFHFEIIEEVENIEDLDEREIYWIKYYDSHNHGYNETDGGYGTHMNGEEHPNHKLSEYDVIDIRKRWASCSESTQEIYQDYKDKIGKSGFKKIYSWQTWKKVLPELYTKENREWHRNNNKNYGSPGEKNNTAILSDMDVYNIRLRYKNGESVRDIYKDYENTGIQYGSFCNSCYGYNRKFIKV